METTPFHKQESKESEPTYDALLVLGACMEWDSIKEKWIFPTWVPENIYKPKLVMGKARAIAAGNIADQAEVLLVTGGPQKHPETGKTHSRAIELSKLITEQGVPEEKIIPMGKGGNTLENAKDTAAYLKDHPEILINKRIAVLSPRFQHERAEMMFNDEPYFKENGITVDWIIVDDVLENRHPLYKNWTKELKETTDPNDEKNLYDKVLESEEKGKKDWEEKKYKPKQ